MKNIGKLMLVEAGGSTFIDVDLTMPVLHNSKTYVIVISHFDTDISRIFEVLTCSGIRYVFAHRLKQSYYHV